MLNRFFFWSAAIAIRTFLLNYMEDVLGLSVAEAQSLSSQLFIILGIGVFLLALPAGAVADRFGRRPLLITAGLTASCGATIFIFGRDLPLLFGAGALIAGGAGIFASASWALATDLVPKNQGALYLALANGATVLGSIGGRLGGPLIDGLNRLFGTVTAGYLVVFAIAALFFAASSLVVLKINPASPEVSPLQAWEPERAL
jgi:MFS family permease